MNEGISAKQIDLYVDQDTENSFWSILVKKFFGAYKVPLNIKRIEERDLFQSGLTSGIADPIGRQSGG